MSNNTLSFRATSLLISLESNRPTSAKKWAQQLNAEGAFLPTSTDSQGFTKCGKHWTAKLAHAFLDEHKPGHKWAPPATRELPYNGMRDLP